jgi:hypothetical protein
MPATAAGGAAVQVWFNSTQLGQLGNWQTPTFDFLRMSDQASSTSVKASIIEVHT